MAKTICERCWISLILRIAVAVLFVAAVVPKFVGGLDSVVTGFQTLFQNSWLPMPLVILHARIVPFIEALLPIWLLVGYRLRLAWVVASLFMVTLAFGMIVAQQPTVAANNYFYLVLCLAGLYFSQFDRWSVDAPGAKGS